MLSSYFISRIVVDLPVELVLPTLFVIITYWMAWLESSLEQDTFSAPRLFYYSISGSRLGPCSWGSGNGPQKGYNTCISSHVVISTGWRLLRSTFSWLRSNTYQ
ncbi:hypothetical protein ACE6H2_026925 [Prunus campanulata]